MTGMVTEQNVKGVRYLRAPDDGRIVAIHVSGDFEEFAKFPPFMDTAEELAHVRAAYRVGDPASERNTKAHITDNAWPLQVILLERAPGGTAMPHYHVPTEELPPLPTRHQIFICQRGRARVGIFTKEGQSLGDVILGKDDLVLMLEGHEVEFLEPKTRLIEIKQGPFPGTDADDKIDLKVVGR